jgi:hypothetical protein
MVPAKQAPRILSKVYSSKCLEEYSPKFARPRLPRASVDKMFYRELGPK